MLFVRLFDLRLFDFVCFLFLFVSGRGCGLYCGTPWTFLISFFAISYLINELNERNVRQNHLRSSEYLMMVLSSDSWKTLEELDIYIDKL